jgi:hypothetical protein
VFTTLTTVAAIDIDAQADDGSTCAHVCAANQHVNLLRALVDLGANLNLVDAYGRTALHTALISLNHQCALLLLAAGIDVHVKDAQGRTVCHYAASGVANSLIPLEILHAVLAARADFDAPDNDGSTPRQICLDHNRSMPTVHEIECAKRRIVRKQLEIVRRRAVQVCLGLQPLGLDALCMCEILAHACGPVAPFVPFHCWWQIATTVKHFAQDNKR